MRILPTIAFALVAASMSVPVSAQDERTDRRNDTVSVDIKTADDMDAGTVSFEQMRHGVLVRVRARNLTEGGHGVHLHETGECAPDFAAAGSHYNPLDSAHGFDAVGGYHVGALTNVIAGADGIARADIFVPQVNLRADENNRYPFTLSDSDGTAIMIHADEDDYVDMNSAGDREACGVIFPPTE